MIRNLLYAFLIFFAVYFLLGGLIFNYLFPPKHPTYVDYFQQKPTLESKVEGVRMRVKKIANDQAFLKVEIMPGAEGPPEHVHKTFDEYFVVEKGSLSILIDGQKKILSEGESIIIKAGTPHKPFNESDEVVILNDIYSTKATMTAEFAYGLAQLYPQMDNLGEANSPKMLLHLAAKGNRFDTWVSDVPIPAQQSIRWLLGPTARLLGF